MPLLFIARLRDMINGHCEKGFGVTDTKFWKQGNVDYKKVVELVRVDLNRYRGKMREEVRVTVEK